MALATLPMPAAHASGPPITAPLPVTLRLHAVLALDLGTSMGWALRLGTETHSGTVSFRPSRYDGGGMRYVRFRGWLDRLAVERALPAAVYFEEVRRHAATDAAHIYGGFLAGLTAWCARCWQNKSTAL